MSSKPIYLLLIIIVVLAASGCVDNTAPDMQLQNYSEPIISMELNHAKTATFCQAQGYSNSDQWIIGEEHSGMYGQKMGYDLWGMDGQFNANDVRVHVDCIGTQTIRHNHSILEVVKWLKSYNTVSESNTTLDIFCQQNNTNFEYRSADIVVCYRSADARIEYTPQDIAKWYIQHSGD